jgi:hypothetical protein
LPSISRRCGGARVADLVEVVVLAARPARSAANWTGARVAALSAPRNTSLNCDHARVGEQQRSGRCPGTAELDRDDGRALGGEEFEEILADLALLFMGVGIGWGTAATRTPAPKMRAGLEFSIESGGKG